MDHKAEDSERYLIAKDAFLSRYTSQRLAKKLLKDLMNTPHLPLCLRHGDGRAHVIERFRGYLQAQEETRNLDRSFGSVESIIIPLLNHGRITSFAKIDRYWGRISDADLTHVFDSFDWLARLLPQADEWTVREVCFRSDVVSGRDDHFFALEEVCDLSVFYDRVLHNYKIIKEKILNEDFDQAREEHGERQRRFSAKTGEGSKFKEVKVRLNPELVDVLNDTVGDGNRTAWIEDAIVQKLHSLGVDYELPEQPPIPKR
ncbi:hypothetical protein ACG74X_10175 [Marivita sp. S0852]|uniref:hypothetical protein n=1 Tax=Marivita sp. S0852 TaxID=3373893 RepID=UPI003981E44A